MKKSFALLLSISVLVALSYLNGQGEATDVETRQESWQQHMKLEKTSIFSNLEWMSTGPCFQGGRISSISVYPEEPYTIYVAAGAGNLWKSTNNTTTWTPVFDHQSTFTIGDIAVAPSDPDVIWVGSGEALMARSSYAGDGVFKSIDGGKTWQNMGLRDTHHIGRVVIHPDDPNTVYIAAIGHNYTYNEERGLYKTTDGGETWEKILYISEKAGVVECVMDPSDPNTLYAAAWERDRKAWNNVESGEGSGIYKTTDAGETWTRCTNGFPTGEFVGRIGLAVSRSNPNIVYALLDNQAPKTTEELAEEEPESGLEILQIREMSKDEFLAISSETMNEFLREMEVPSDYNAEMVFNMVRRGELTPESFAQYLLDLHLDRKLHVTDVIGGEVYRSDDKGETWQKVNQDYFNAFFSTYGYSFCDIRVSPDDPEQIYVCGIRLFRSDDGGKTYKQIGRNVHADHHDIWVDPHQPQRVLLGNDGGLDISYDRGETWQPVTNLPIAEFYTISVDMEEPYNIYGGLQDNGTVFGPSTYRPGYMQEDPWQHLGGGDGFFVFVDPVDPNIVYWSYQFGPVLRTNRKTGDVKNIMPKSKIGQPPLRANWMTPYIISQHNHHVLYYGANILFKSLDRGDHWTAVSEDLTTEKPYGDVPYSTITTISESPFQPGLLYAGTDDGNVWVTRDDGGKWTNISASLPDKWVSRVIASRYKKGRVYVSLTGYRDDDFSTYLYKSEDYGQNWTSMAGNLPHESVNVIREDPKAHEILYAGTDLGVYISIDQGRSWQSLNNNLPTAPVHDLVVHPRDNELVIGTHGRSAYILDVQPVQEFVREDIQEQPLYLFDSRPAELPGREGSRKNLTLTFYLDKPREVDIAIIDKKGDNIKRYQLDGRENFNTVTWNLVLEGERRRLAEPGEYTVEVSAEDISVEKTVIIQE
jgi:photosystem II stability/assembly factor-like uncharacterized protein